MIWSNAPWVPSGYGKQAKYAGQILRDLGHEVAYTAYSGHSGTPIKWEGFTVFPSGMLDYGIDVLVQHCQIYQPDLLVLLGDLWKLEPLCPEFARMPCKIMGFSIIDASPLPPSFKRTLINGNMIPVAVSEWSQEVHHAEGLEALYIPHCVDTTIYSPCTSDRKRELRTSAGIPEDSFCIGICGANQDIMRKGYNEQLQAFSVFSKTYDTARLLIFSITDHPRGLNLVQICNDLGIADKVHFIGSYGQVAGLIDDEDMASWYRQLDVLSMASYGEGFGVPAIEAMACGIPVAATDGSACAEWGSAGYLIYGTRYWNAVHRSYWIRPSESSIIKAWSDARNDRERGEDRATQLVHALYAEQYSINAVTEDWIFTLEQVVKRVSKEKGTVAGS